MGARARPPPCVFASAADPPLFFQHPDPTTLRRLQDLSESDFDDDDDSASSLSDGGGRRPSPPPPPRRRAVGTAADLAAQVDAWLAGRPAPTAAALACDLCPGVLLAGPAAARNHVASKKHGKACAVAGMTDPSTPLKFAAAPDDVETHAERAQRVAAAAAAAAAAKAARNGKNTKNENKKRAGRGARRPGKRPGKRQRAALKAAAGKEV